MSPFKSRQQRAWMHIHMPKTAERWEKEAKRRGINPVRGR